MLATTIAGSTSMPTETKKSTEKKSRKGTTSALTWWWMSDSPMTTPARNAPRASDTSNNSKAAKAVPRAMVTMARMNSSRERV